MLEPTHRNDTGWALYRSRGWWEDRTTYSLFAEQAKANADSLAVIDGEFRLMYGDLSRAVDRVAYLLDAELGVRPGDVVGYQLPNWWETVVVLLACSRVGAVVNPLHLVYRPNDLRYVVQRTQPKVVFVTNAHSDPQSVRTARTVLAEAGLDTVVCAVRADAAEEGAVAFPPMQDAGGELPLPPPASDPGAISLVLYTSGTTARPKGALHSENTLVRMVRDMIWVYDFEPDDVIFVPSSMTHVSGLSFVWSALFTGGAAALLARWDAAAAVRVVRETGSTFVGGATPFIRGLVDGFKELGLAPDEVPLQRGNCGSADVPPNLIREADAVLGAPFSRGYGLTEGIIITVSRPADTLEHRGGTDGAMVPTNEVRIVDEDGCDLPPGSEGEILVRGPSNFLGYLDPADNDGVFAAHSWIHTGDLGVLDADGYLRITGRLKDLISRGGENISVKEVEDCLAGHPAVAGVAVVGMPDPVMGERCCAFVVPTDPTAPPTLDDLTATLARAGMAKFKWPERLEVRTVLPTTSTGKVQKKTLRDEIRQVVDAEQLARSR